MKKELEKKLRIQKTKHEKEIKEIENNFNSQILNLNKKLSGYDGQRQKHIHNDELDRVNVRNN